MGFDDPSLALRTRKVIDSLVREIIDQERPGERLGQVTAINPDLRACYVLFPGATESMPVAMGAIQPSAVGQIVRVAGRAGDRFVIDVLGHAVVTGTPSGSLTTPAGFSFSPSAEESVNAIWSASPNAYRYEVQFAESADFTVNPRAYYTFETYYREPNIAPGTHIWGRVRTLNSTGGFSTWSTLDDVVVTIYPGGSDGSPPAGSPAVTCTEAIGFIIAQWLPQVNADTVTYEVHVSLSSGFTPGPATKLGETTGTSFMVRTLANGSIVPFNTNIFVRLIAKDGDGAAGPGAQGFAQAKQVELGDVGNVPTSAISDGVPPTTSPNTPVITPGPGFFFMTWTHPSNPDALTYEVHVSTVNNFTPSSATKVLETPSNFAFVKTVGSGAGGGALAYGTTYYIKVWAKDLDGYAAAAGTQSSSQVLKVNTADINAGAVTSAEMNIKVNGENILRDASFENSTPADHWVISVGTGSFARQATGGISDGAYLLSARSEASGWNSAVQSFIPRPNQKMSARLMWGMSANCRQAHVKVDFYTNSTRTTHVGTWFITPGTDGPVGVWTEVVKQGSDAYTVPATAGFADFALMAGYSSNGSPANTYFDQIKIAYGDIVSDFSLNSLDLYRNVVTADQLAANSVIVGKIAANAVTTTTLAANAVTAAKIAANTITANEIAASTITGGNIAANTITGGNIQAASINGDRITANTLDVNRLTTSSLTAQTITLAGGSIQGGTPVTGSGFIINSQGIQFWTSGVRTFFADNSTGALTVTGSIVGGTVTGAIVQTATSGQRVVLGSTAESVYFYTDRSGGDYYPGQVWSFYSNPNAYLRISSPQGVSTHHRTTIDLIGSTAGSAEFKATSDVVRLNAGQLGPITSLILSPSFRSSLSASQNGLLISATSSSLAGVDITGTGAGGGYTGAGVRIAGTNGVTLDGGASSNYIYMRSRVSLDQGIRTFGDTNNWWPSWNFPNLTMVVDGTDVGKSFVIDHPSMTKSDKQWLVHSCIEGPENAVYYRGSIDLDKNLMAEVVLPAYFEDLTAEEGRTVQLTLCNDEYESKIPFRIPPFRGIILAATYPRNGRFKITGVLGAGKIPDKTTVFWEVKAVRKDIEPLIVEASKKDYLMGGLPPYTFLKRK